MSTLRAAVTTFAVISISAGGVAYAEIQTPTPPTPIPTPTPTLTSPPALTSTPTPTLTSTPTPTPSRGGSAQDKNFLVEAHQGNLAEIAAGTLAKEKGTAADVRSIGALLVADHTKLDNALKAAAAKLNVPLPTQPSPAQKAEHDRLAAMTGAAFDKAWVNAMIKAHRMTLASGKKELRTGSSPEAKQIATSSAPVIKTHLSRLLKARATIERPTVSPTPTGTGH